MTRSTQGAATILGLLERAHDVGLVNENALAEILGELLDGGTLTLSMLCSIFGVETINNLLDRRTPVKALTPEQGERLKDIYDLLNTTPDWDVAPGIVRANLQLVELLKEVL